MSSETYYPLFVENYLEKSQNFTYDLLGFYGINLIYNSLEKEPKPIYQILVLIRYNEIIKQNPLKTIEFNISSRFVNGSINSPLISIFKDYYPELFYI